MQPKFVYDLAFVPKSSSVSRKPEIRVSMSDMTYIQVLVRLGEQANENGEMRKWLGVKHPRFFDGDKVFGYMGCGRVEQEGVMTHLYFELRMGQIRPLVATFVLLTHLLRGYYNDGGVKSGEKHQLLDIAIYNNPTPHGYCPEGRSFPAFGRWLKRQSGVGGTRTVDMVRAAMAETWRSVAPLAVRPLTRECSCSFSKDGRFSLSCPGDSCDLSIYYDGVIGDIAEYGARIHSHNVEAPHQQITLLTGLAVMWALARRDSERAEEATTGSAIST